MFRTFTCRMASLSEVGRHRRLLADFRLVSGHDKHSFRHRPRHFTVGSRTLDVSSTNCYRQKSGRSGACFRSYSDGLGVTRLPAFEHAGPDVAQRFVQRDQILDKIDWDREEKYDALAQELIELHVGLQLALSSKDNPSAAHGNDRRVERLGHGVFVQHNKLPIEKDAQEGNTATITREESRSVAHHALDALKERYNVCVTGQPGIGKTRGSMMYALQTLLHRKAAVLYVGYKSEKMLLFLPGEDGRYRAWTQSTDNVGQTLLKTDARVVMVIDPPEDEPYSSRGECRVLKFVSNNAEKHFRNWEKDGVLLVTSMPSEEEVVAMTTVLWDRRTTPYPWQDGEFMGVEERITEVQKRIRLVGPIPRLIFNWKLFRYAIRTCLSGAEKAARDVSDIDLYKAMRGKYSPYLGKHPASSSSNIFFLNPHATRNVSLVERELKPPMFQLTPIAAHVLKNRLLERIEKLKKMSFEDFAYDVLCERWDMEADRGRFGESTWEDCFRRLVKLQRDGDVLFRPNVSNFPFVDFAKGVTVWYNAKSGDPKQKTVTIEHKGALRFLGEMEKYMLEYGSVNVTRQTIRNELKDDPPTLSIVTNGAFSAVLDKEVDLTLFDIPVRIEVMNLGEKSAQELLDGLDRTKKALRELKLLTGRIEEAI